MKCGLRCSCKPTTFSTCFLVLCHTGPIFAHMCTHRQNVKRPLFSLARELPLDRIVVLKSALFDHAKSACTLPCCWNPSIPYREFEEAAFAFVSASHRFFGSETKELDTGRESARRFVFQASYGMNGRGRFYVNCCRKTESELLEIDDPLLVVTLLFPSTLKQNTCCDYEMR